MAKTADEMASIEAEIKNLGDELLKSEEEISETRAGFLMHAVHEAFKEDADDVVYKWKEIESQRRASTEKIIELLEDLINSK